MKIDLFDVEAWMTEHEVDYRYNLAETCVASMSINDLLEMVEEKETVIKNLFDTKLNYGENSCIWEFTPEDNKNYHITSGSVTITVKDMILPTAKYRIGTEERAFKELNDKTTTSDSIFCEVGAFVEIMAIDDTENVSGSGVKEVSYSIEDSEKEITDITINAITWEKYNAPVPLNATGSCIIYVKVVDNASNSAILKSEKILVYGESSIKPETLSYHYKANTDASVTLTLNGNTFQELTDEDGTENRETAYEN